MRLQLLQGTDANMKRFAIFAVLGAFASLSGGAIAQDISMRIGPQPAKVEAAKIRSGPPAEIHNVIVDTPVPAREVARRKSAQQDASMRAGRRKTEILFGDLHAHTAYSDDAFLFGMPIMQSRRELRPPMSACNYARYVAQLDFLGTTDHGESYLPQLWKDGINAMRLCNSVGASNAPDLTAFVGYEWTSIARLPPDHFGHRNVILKGLKSDEVSARSIGVYRSAFIEAKESWIAADKDKEAEYRRYLEYLTAYRKLPACADNLPSPQLSVNCYELALTPQQLFRKFKEWDIQAIAIPHGMSWGYSSPLSIDWNNNLQPEHLSNHYSPIIEIFSGHGSSELYRPARPRNFDANGKPYCAPPTANFEPNCWRAGIIIKERCLKSGETSAICEFRERQARQRYVEVSSPAGWMTVPGAEVTDWLDSGQPRDIPLPAMNYRPDVSAQAGLARSRFINGERQRFIWGFVASSDNHQSRPGNGFKQVNRVRTIDGFGGVDQHRHDLLMGPRPDPKPESVVIPEFDRSMLPFNGLEVERQSSFMYTGGLIAVHAATRNRDGIWDGIQRREVYATTGSRTLLWFDLVNGGSDGKTRRPMGSLVQLQGAPQFKVVVAGSHEQLPGCPAFVQKTLGKEAMQHLSDGECYNPSSNRRPIVRIDVIKITPQQFEGEPLDELIKDQWRSFDCKGKSICEVEFSDESFDRDSTYYVRAFEQARPTINAATVRPVKDKSGEVISVAPCHTDYRTPEADDCLAPFEPIAWSSPIYLEKAQ